MSKADVFTIDAYTVSREKALEFILSAYAKAIEAIKERNYTASDIKYISCERLTEILCADKVVLFALYVELQDGQRYRRPVRVRVSTKVEGWE